MNKPAMHVLFLAFFLTILSSCKKNESENPSPTAPVDPLDTSSVIPSTFSQKVLIEMFTSANFGNCTDGLSKLEQAVTTNPQKIIPVCLHDADGMSIAQTFTYTSTFAVTAYPSGMINRVPSLSNIMLQPSQFSSNASVTLSKTAKCGLAISSTLDNNVASITVKAGFSDTLTGNYNLTVYLTEEEVTGTGNMFDQKNNYNTSSGHAYYNQGNPIMNFKHNHVLRKVLSINAMGDEITAAAIKSQGVFTNTFSINTAAYATDKVYLVAFINRVGSSTADMEIKNVQIAKLNTVKNWD